MRYSLLILPFLLAGCLATPVKRNFPEVPPELKVACPDLQKVKDGAQLSEDRKSTRLNSSHVKRSRMPSSA